MVSPHAADTRLRTPARWRSAPVPDGYGSIPHTAATGAVHLPTRLWWSGQSPVFDLTIKAERRRVYELVLQVGSAQDVEQLIDPDLLCQEWDTLIRPAAVRETWQPWIDAQRNLR